MNCANHPDQAAVAFCRTCGKPLCQGCQRPAQGTIFCEEHFPVEAAAGSPYAAPYPPPGASPYVYGHSPYTTNPGVSPGLAFLLGLIPGVGAIYNGQYAKGLIHAVIFGFLVSIPSSGAAGGFEPLFGLMIAIWFFYMAFEAYHTAQKRQRGEVVDEFSSIFPMGRRTARKGFPAGPVVMIAVGIIFLLNTLEVVRLYEILRWWPVFLIVLGGYMLYVRIVGDSADAVVPPQEVRHEP
jgi:hypothetical protein